MATTKTNYTTKQVARMREVYIPTASQVERDAQVEQLMDEMGKNKQSIRSKLVNEKIYVKAAETSKVTGAAPAKKIVMAEKLVEVSGVNVDADGKETRANAESVEKMNKTDIQFFDTKIRDLLETVARYQDEFGELPEIDDSSELDHTDSENG